MAGHGTAAAVPGCPLTARGKGIVMTRQVFARLIRVMLVSIPLLTAPPVAAETAVNGPAACGWHVLAVDGTVDIHRQAEAFPATGGTALKAGDIVAPRAGGACELISDAAVILSLGPGETFVAEPPAGAMSKGPVRWLAARIADWTGRGREAAMRARAGDGAPMPVFPAASGLALPGEVTLIWLGAGEEDESWRVRLLDGDSNFRELPVEGQSRLNVEVRAGQTVTWQVESSNGARSPMRSFRTLTSSESDDLAQATAGRDPLAAGIIHLLAGLHAEAWSRFGAVLPDDRLRASSLRWQARVLDDIGLAHEQDAIAALIAPSRRP